ncbi:putative homing endonuclease [Staphylococcus phage S25-3]|uniref:Homing endonuclease n=2 Tax=Kayvirus TaxID=1857843 RepID=V5XVP3_BPS25|nr:putative homing endonuclease [Staphylococcus phage S25-4]YP_008854140.1 putative homing endonuclease [Staphylococcus phage S25-3]BAO09168.1 putative homing endonuclease [Staphylococcus phage S25-3]BAO09376.1 putative homing endonuclease [Staphylococcus phage S25-4]
MNNRVRMRDTLDRVCLIPKVKFRLKDDPDEVWVDMMLHNDKKPNDSYYISNKGRIATYKYKQDKYDILYSEERTRQQSLYGYWSLNKGRFSIHRLVACYFNYKPYSYDMDVHHINGDKRDNRLENLEFLSRTEHYYRELELGGRPSTHEMRIQERKYSEADVKNMRKMHSEGYSMSHIAREYDDRFGTIRQIIKRITYKDIE